MEYTGVDNLEAMNEAVNYNAHLTQMALAAAAGARLPIMDFGAGLGAYAEAIREKNPSVLCFEVDPLLVSRLRQAGFKVYEVPADVPTGGVDCIYSFNVLEHIEDDRGAIENLFRWMAPGGKLYLYVPAFMCLYSAMDRKVGHVRRYRRSELMERVRAAGFEVNSCRYSDSLGFFASLVFKFSGNQSGKISPMSVRIYDRIAYPLSRRLDSLLGLWFGKNVYLYGTKPTAKS